MGKKRKVGDSCNHFRNISQDDCRICEPIKKSNGIRNRSKFDLINPPRNFAALSRASKKVSYLTAKCKAVGISFPSNPLRKHIAPGNDGNGTSRNISEQTCVPERQDHQNQEEDADTYAQVNEIGSSLGLNSPKIEKDFRYLPLKPLFFEVPQEEEQTYVQREWLYIAIENIFQSKPNGRGIIIHGGPGTGKTTMTLQLVEHSCFGRKSKLNFDPDGNLISNGTEISTLSHNTSFFRLVSRVVAYHFCQVDYRTTCLVADLVHSIAAQLCQAPTLTSYRTFLEENQNYLDMLSIDNCMINPASAFVEAILEPLGELRKTNKIPEGYFFIILDSVGEAESHKYYAGDTITSFLSKHCLKIPSWLKIIVTIRTNQLDILSLLPYSEISLDNVDESISQDLQEYIAYRFDKFSKLNSSIIANRPQRTDSNLITNLKSHIKQISGGCFLFLKLTLDLIGLGHLVIKSSSFKIFPVSLSEVFMLHCNLRFPTQSAFGFVLPILSVCLAALNPLNLLEIYHSVNSLQTRENLPWVEFLRIFKNVQGLLVKRLDGTYMFFHSSFRDWLSGQYGSNYKFLCDTRMGHAAIAFRLIRVETPLTLSKTLDLAHHMLKANVFKDECKENREMQAIWLLSSTSQISEALVSFSNIYCTNLKVSRLLLLAGASPNSRTWLLNNAPLLVVCAAECNIGLLSLLLEFNADINAENEVGDTALHIASEMGHLQIVQYLVKHGAKLSKLNNRQQCSMVNATLANQIETLTFFISNAWDEDKTMSISKDEAILHCLVVASGLGYLPIVQILLEHCKMINVSEKFSGETALSAACKNDKLHVVELLLRKGANVNAPDQYITSPLILAVNSRNHSIMQILLRNGANVNGLDELKRTALIASARNDDLVAAEILIQHESIIDCGDKDGISALGWSCIRGNLNVCKYLLQYTYEINKPDVLGRTPLHLAAFSGNEKIIQLLLDKGGQMESTDRKGIRPLDQAIACNNVNVVQLFLKKGAKLGANTWNMAAGNPIIISILLNKLLDDGKFFYQSGQFQEAENRFQYALKKISFIESNEDAVYLEDIKQMFLVELLNCKKVKNATEKVSKITEDIIIALDPEFQENV